MDLRWYLGPLTRKLWLIGLTVVIAAGAAWAYASFVQPTRYTGELFMTIALTDDQQTAEYKFGNYYANYASIEFARTASGWIQSADFVERVYRDARVDPSTDVDILGKLFGAISVTRVERANMDFRIRSLSSENAERLLIALRESFARQLTTYNAAAGTKYVVANPQARVDVSAPAPLRAAGLGALVGLILGILLAYIVEFSLGVVLSPEQVADLLGVEPTFVLRRRDAHLATVLAAHVASLPSAPLLVGASVDPSRLALRMGHALHAQGGAVSIVEGQRRLLLSRLAGAARQGIGWSDEARTPKGPIRLSGKLMKSVGSGVSVAPYGRSARAAVGRLLEKAAPTTFGVIAFPSGAHQLSDLAASVPVLTIVKLGTTRADDLRHIRRFLQGHPASVSVLV